jgi:hypothetical protein
MLTNRQLKLSLDKSGYKEVLHKKEKKLLIKALFSYEESFDETFVGFLDREIFEDLFDFEGLLYFGYGYEDFSHEGLLEAFLYTKDTNFNTKTERCDFTSTHCDEVKFKKSIGQVITLDSGLTYILKKHTNGTLVAEIL